MNILFLGDVVGRSGRDAVVSHVKQLREEWNLDFVIVNGDNAAGGFGITPAICKDFYEAGVDVITGGDHVWDQREATAYLSEEKRLLRPQNYPERTPGIGHHVYEAGGKRVLVIHTLGQVFIRDQVDCPFAAADTILEAYRLGGELSAIVVDFHAEATSEKTAMGKYLDGRVSMVTGSHTHVPTADARVLPKGTAFQTDAGMCGDYDSVIGFDAEGPLKRFLTKLPKVKLEAARGEGTLCGLLVETDDATGLAKSCKSVQYPNMLGSNT
ncbi:MAG: TIGR00282 family metallophosphoesterase [Rickettsiales bacterium]